MATPTNADLPIPSLCWSSVRQPPPRRFSYCSLGMPRVLEVLSCRIGAWEYREIFFKWPLEHNTKAWSRGEICSQFCEEDVWSISLGGKFGFTSLGLISTSKFRIPLISISNFFSGRHLQCKHVCMSWLAMDGTICIICWNIYSHIVCVKTDTLYKKSDSTTYHNKITIHIPHRDWLGLWANMHFAELQPSNLL